MGSRDRGRAAPVRAGAPASASQAQREAKEIEECEKIVRFRDAILAGNHPSIKLPPGLKALSTPLPTFARPPSEPGEVDTRPEAAQKLATGKQDQTPSVSQPQPPADARAPQATGPQHPKPFANRTTEINPILLEKSDELVRAEIQLQRQRIERSLKDDIEQRRASKQVQAEPVIEFDLSDVLAKALTLVQATTIPFSANGDLSANHEAASDSFDDNTFYSSKHDTPESNLTSRVRHSSDEAMVTDDRRPSLPRSHASTGYGNIAAPSASANGHYAAGPPSRPSTQVPAAAPAAAPAPAPVPAPPLVTSTTASRPQQVRVPGLHILANSGISPATQAPAITARTEPVRELQAETDDSGDSALQYDPARPALPPGPPVVRNHDLIPVAPQPAKIAPLTVVNAQTPVIDSTLAASLGTSAQVAALRHGLDVPASSESSSQGAKETERKRGKKNKRKADRQALEAQAGPSIKVEPRSQSPMTAPAYNRPSKRQRHSQAHANDSGQSEPRYAQPPPNAAYEQPPPQAFPSERAPATYHEPGPAQYLPHSASIRGEPAGAPNPNSLYDPRVPGESYARPAPLGESYMRQPQTRDPVSYSIPPPREVHGPAAVPQVISYDSYREPIRIYREPLEGARASVRPEGESFIVPPRPPTRVMVDSYGREFVEPLISSARQSVAPMPRSGEPEVIYERLPPRTLSNNLGPAPHNEGNVVYARPLSIYDPVRRVYVSEPEYPYEHRDGQFSDHQLQQRGYIQIVRSHDGRIIEERPAEYVPRGPSYRPPERMRFEPAQPYIRMHSARPEAPGREYSGNVHMDGRHPEGPQAYSREYGSSPMQRAPTIHREYSMRPPERYHEPQGGAPRGTDEIAFIERPRGASREIVYVDDVRREVYR
ncbi:hypothetical protein BBK36DRAFT_1155375 [Trichoderma citrinoviride]|uniref:Uncharacterized protein n=1 Tax=Trichoderma citrinoviride TaxID=58853 RepID=A0A2T4BMQ4_9HYPO|nr:hypothetical protein BBK36DRAFT_1155375 [Trichoderma citrinoviride]PTB70576.1 hypothetical protein BBK36DRAFT_1155375 [Trichoderma citrinoviride]